MGTYVRVFFLDTFPCSVDGWVSVKDFFIHQEVSVEVFSSTRRSLLKKFHPPGGLCGSGPFMST